jgi:hypothetical protein
VTRLPIALVAGAAVLGAQLASAQSAAAPSDNASGPTRASEKRYSLDFKPVVLDKGSSSGTALGLDYDLKANYPFLTSQTGAGNEVVRLEELDKTFTAGQLDLRARGSLASSKDKNPNKLLDFLADGVLVVDSAFAYYKAGARFAYETDQGFDNKQHLFGIAASASKVRILIPGDAGSAQLGFGSVVPDKNEERKKLLGSLSTFKRWDAELSYSIPIRNKALRSIDFDYRHYQEVNAPDAIKAAGMDRNRLGLVRANLDHDFFLQYSRGSLPFDQKSERAVKLGWSMKFE